MASISFLYTILASSVLATAKTETLQPRWDNGLAQTPPMGWNSYNHYSCNPNESIIMSNAQALVDLGLADLGYSYATCDCGWTIPDRTSNGTLTWNATIFPNGFPALGDFIHSLGLKFGVYSDAGIQMCATSIVPNQTGSLYHEQTDANTFSAWGADLLKYDNCYSDEAAGWPDAEYTPSTSPAGRYQTMHNAIINTGRDILYQICEWGIDFPSAWAPALGNTWRVTNDIIPAWRTIYRIVNQVVPQTSFAGPHQWLDLDMLEVGNDVFTTPEEQTHFSLWAILKSPLVIGAALNDTFTTINPTSLAILKNKDVIALNQDSLGVSANLTRRWTEEGFDVWAGPISGNRTVAALVNWNDFTLNATLDLPDVGLQSAGSVKDIWNNITVENVQTSYSKAIPPHGTLLLVLSDTLPAGYYPISASDKTTTNLTTIKNIYGITTSPAYNATLTFTNPLESSSTIIISTNSNTPKTYTIPANSNTLSIPLSLLAKNTNTLTLSTRLTLTTLIIANPLGSFYPSTSFSINGTAAHTTCISPLCAPVGAKITDLTESGSATILIPRNSTTTNSTNSTTTTARYLHLYYINNDIALSTSWTTGRNARNITLAINGHTPRRLEVPLSGRSSELFSPMDGWGDVGVLGILTEGWGVDGEKGDNDEVVVSNFGGGEGVQAFGADFVGVRVF